MIRRVVFITLLVACIGSAEAQTDVAPGMQLTDDGRTWQVLAVEDHGVYSTYVLEVDGRPACGTSNAEALPAIPLEGTWDATMAWRPDGLTLACVDGPIGKCVAWGYHPWLPGLRDLHQACVRMVRADYCGTGEGQTRDGTPIDVWDIRGINKSSEVPGMTFEAEWRPDGAVRIRRTRFPWGIAYVRARCPERLDLQGAIREHGVLANASYPIDAPD